MGRVLFRRSSTCVFAEKMRGRPPVRWAGYCVRREKDRRSLSRGKTLWKRISAADFISVSRTARRMVSSAELGQTFFRRQGCGRASRRRHFVGDIGGYFRGEMTRFVLTRPRKARTLARGASCFAPPWQADVLSSMERDGASSTGKFIRFIMSRAAGRAAGIRTFVSIQRVWF